MPLVLGGLRVSRASLACSGGLLFGINRDMFSRLRALLVLWCLGLRGLLLSEDRPQLSVCFLLAGTLYFCFYCSRLLWVYILFEASLIPIRLLVLLYGPQPERVRGVLYL